MMEFLATGFGLFVCAALFVGGIVGQLCAVWAVKDYKIEESTGGVLVFLSLLITGIGSILGLISLILQIGLFFSHH